MGVCWRPILLTSSEALNKLLTAGIRQEFWVSIHKADGRLNVRSREVSKPRDSSLDFSNRFEIWQTPRHRCCRGACHISERYGQHNI